MMVTVGTTTFITVDDRTAVEPSKLSSKSLWLIVEDLTAKYWDMLLFTDILSSISFRHSTTKPLNNLISWIRRFLYHDFREHVWLKWYWYFGVNPFNPEIVHFWPMEQSCDWLSQDYHIMVSDGLFYVFRTDCLKRFPLCLPVLSRWVLEILPIPPSKLK